MSREAHDDHEYDVLESKKSIVLYKNSLLQSYLQNLSWDRKMDNVDDMQTVFVTADFPMNWTSDRNFKLTSNYTTLIRWYYC